MLSLDDRIDLLKRDLIADPPSFVMTRELPFAIFRYDPNHPDESEWTVRRKIQMLSTQVENETRQLGLVLTLGIVGLPRRLGHGLARSFGGAPPSTPFRA